jgi:hypothetical protein
MLTNYDLSDKCKKLGIPLVGIYCKDQLPYTRKDGCYIINMQDNEDVNGNENPGTHWVSAIINNKQACYFDAFGCVPPRNVQEFLAPYKPFPYNTKEIQNIMSEVCGWYCIYFLYWMMHNNNIKSMKERLELFTNQFSNDVKKNETLLKKYLQFVK